MRLQLLYTHNLTLETFSRYYNRFDLVLRYEIVFLEFLKKLIGIHLSHWYLQTKLYVMFRYVIFLTMASILIAILGRIETTSILASSSKHVRPCKWPSTSTSFTRFTCSGYDIFFAVITVRFRLHIITEVFISTSYKYTKT